LNRQPNRLSLERSVATRTSHGWVCTKLADNDTRPCYYVYQWAVAGSLQALL